MYKITAVITTYNRPVEYINRALVSIEKQTYPVFETIVVDDNRFAGDCQGGLSDMSLEIKKLCENRAIYIKQPKGNAGANAARNLAIDNAKGDFVAFLDDDDEWLPEKTEKEMALFDEETGLVFCSGIQSEEGKSEIPYYNLKIFNCCPTHADMLRRDHIGSTSQPIIRKSVFEKCGKFDENMPARQDYEMWLRITSKYKVRGVPDKLFVHHIHSFDQITKSTDKAYRGYRLVYKKYKADYKKDIQALLTIKKNIYKNQPGLLGKINWFKFRVKRKILRMCKVI